ncbi:putative Acetyl-coenzyme A transporter, partial [Toxoplasma gondii RUB]
SSAAGSRCDSSPAATFSEWGCASSGRVSSGCLAARVCFLRRGSSGVPLASGPLGREEACGTSSEATARSTLWAAARFFFSISPTQDPQWSRLLSTALVSGAVAMTGHLLADDGGAQMSSSHWAALYGAMFLITGVYSVCSDLMFVSQMAFFAQVSDPRIGGTYMTFLNTVTNLGVKWPHTLSLLLMDVVGVQDCSDASDATSEVMGGAAPACRVVLDAYFVQVAACFLAGVLWLALCWRRVEALQQVPLAEWRVEIRRPNSSRGDSDGTELKRVEK